jgi:hypothetical protein
MKPYADQFEQTLRSRALCKTQTEEANKLDDWGQKNLAKEKRVKVSALEVYIRDRIKSWEGKVPWKAA